MAFFAILMVKTGEVKHILCSEDRRTALKWYSAHNGRLSILDPVALVRLNRQEFEHLESLKKPGGAESLHAFRVRFKQRKDIVEKAKKRQNWGYIVSKQNVYDYVYEPVAKPAPTIANQGFTL